jgi:hypothetical protein
MSWTRSATPARNAPKANFVPDEYACGPRVRFAGAVTA